jgi:hypothetical protein
MKIPDFYVKSRYIQKYLILLQNLILKVTYLHNFVVLEQIVTHKANMVLPPTSAPLVPHGLEIVAPFWAISIALTHLIPSLALKDMWFDV